MIRKAMGPLAVLLVLASAGMFLPACSPNDENETDTGVDAVAIDITVDHDDIFGHSLDDVLGDIWFSDSQGPVGTPVDVVIQFDNFSRFKDQTLNGVITLMNPNAIKDEDWSYEFTVDSARTEFTLIVPQVITVPAILNFQVVFSAESETNPDDYFEASLIYQFLVNQGTPAT